VEFTNRNSQLLPDAWLKFRAAFIKYERPVGRVILFDAIVTTDESDIDPSATGVMVFEIVEPDIAICTRLKFSGFIGEYDMILLFYGDDDHVKTVSIDLITTIKD
jgi:hypothetical protein